MSSPKTLPSLKILEDVKPLLDNVTLLSGDTFLWSPKDRTVVYDPVKLSTDIGQWSLLHEIAHATLQHQTYESDFELLQLEVAAWKEAKQLAATFHRDIDDKYVEDCLDTYREWLHQRSTCPTCGSVGLQHDPREYRCHNCLSTWHVSQSRFCRPYRMKQISKTIKKSSDHTDQTTFR
jgi:hypothetical protein